MPVIDHQNESGIQKEYINKVCIMQLEYAQLYLMSFHMISQPDDTEFVNMYNQCSHNYKHEHLFNANVPIVCAASVLLRHHRGDIGGLTVQLDYNCSLNIIYCF